MKIPAHIFISYSHKDIDFCKALSKHIISLERQGIVSSWYDGKINPGDNWQNEIYLNLDNSDLILLLVSSDFIASDFCWHKELKTAIEKHENGSAKVIPIIIRPVQWHNTPFANIQALPEKGKPISTWKNHDQAYANIIGYISKIIANNSSPNNKYTINNQMTTSTADNKSARNLASVDLTLPMNFEDFNEFKQKKLLSIINSALEVFDEVRIRRIQKGSVKLVIEIPAKYKSIFNDKKGLFIAAMEKSNEILFTNMEKSMDKLLALADKLEEQKINNPLILNELIPLYQRILVNLMPCELQASILTDLGNAYHDLPTGDKKLNLENAINCYKQALVYRTSTSAPLDYARTQSNMGVSYSELPATNRNDNLEKAIDCFNNASQFFTITKTPMEYAANQNNLGLAYSYLLTGNRNTNLQRAIECYKRALECWSPTTAPINYAMAQNNLGNAYRELHIGSRIESLKLAINFFNNSLKFFTLNTTPFQYASVQLNLGNVYCEFPAIDRKEYIQKAIQHFNEALRIFTRNSAPLYYAMVQNGLAYAYMQNSSSNGGENQKKAIQCLDNALQICDSTNAPLYYAEIENNIGFAHKSFSNGTRDSHFEEAVKHFNNALKFQTSTVTPHYFRRTMRNLGDAYFSQKEWKLALKSYYSAMEAGEFLYQTGSSIETKTNEIFENSTLFHKAAYSAAQLGLNHSDEALLLLEQGKTRLLTETLRLHPSRPKNVPDQVWQQYEQTKNEIKKFQLLESSLSSQELKVISMQELNEHNDAVQKLKESLTCVTEVVHRFAPKFMNTIDMPTIRELVSDDATAVISFCITEHGSLCFILTQNQGLEIIPIPAFTNNFLECLLNQEPASGYGYGGWVGAYLNRRKNPETREIWLATMDKVLEVIGAQLLSPILMKVPVGIQKLILIPSGGLFLLPLHAAPVKLQDRNLSHACEYFQISYAPSAAVLAECKNQIKTNGKLRFYGVFDPSLNCAPVECQIIAKNFEEHKLQDNHYGVKEAMLQEMWEYTYLHFACHGSYNWDDPQESLLNITSKSTLSLIELQNNHKIDTSNIRLVTLSACETGLSDVFSGNSDEYIGLPSGFIMAGVPCVLSSLWVVNDPATAILMDRFYHYHLKGSMSYAAAMQQAQMDLRRMTRAQVIQFFEQHPNILNTEEMKATLPNKPYEHPIYWAAFTVTGM